MRQVLFFIGALLLFQGARAQSGVLQRSSEARLDEISQLFHLHQFSAARFSYERFLKDTLYADQLLEAQFKRAIAALEAEDEDAEGLFQALVRTYRSHPRSSEAAFYLGNFRFDKRDYAGALRAYASVRAADVWPEQRDETTFKQGYAHMQLKQDRQALHYFNYLKERQGNYRPDAYYYAGYLELKAGNTDAAVQNLREADRYPFYQSKVPYLLAALYYEQKAYEELIAYAEEVLQKRGNVERKERIHVYVSEAYFEKRNFERAAFHFDAFVNARRGDLSIGQVYKAGIAQFEIKNYQRATDYFKVSAVGDDAIAQVSSYYLGHAYVKLNNPNFALNAFETAARLDARPDIKEEAYFNFAKLSLERGNFQQAVNAIDTYIENYPNGKYKRQAEELLADALINTSNYLRAIEMIEKMGRQGSSNRIQSAYQRITYYQGIVYFRDANYRQAQVFFDKSLSKPLDADLVKEATFWKGEALAAAGDEAGAIRVFERLISGHRNEVSPAIMQAHYALAYAYFNTQQYEKAEREFETYINKQSRSQRTERYEDALLRLADTYYVQKKFTNASLLFQRALDERVADQDYAHFRLGVIQNFQGNNRAAVQSFSTVVRQFPNSRYVEDALFQRSQVHMEELQYREAIEGFGQLITTRPNSPFQPFALEGRAIANFSLQQYEQSVKDYKSLLDNFPNASNIDQALVGLQESLVLLGRAGEFSNYMSAYRRANPDNQSVQQLEFESAKSLFLSGKFRDAVAAFGTYMRNYPQAANQLEAKLFLAESHFRLENTTEAARLYQEIVQVRTSPQRVRAVQRLAGIELANKQYRRAVPFFREWRGTARTKMDEYESNRGLMQAYAALSNPDSVVFFAEEILRLGSITPESQPEALLMKGKAQLAQNRTAQASGTLTELYKAHKTIQGAEALYMVAEMKRKERAFAASNELIFDESAAFSAYDYWYGMYFILLADNYQELGETFQAKSTLNSVIEGSANAEIRTKARERLKELDKK